MMKSTWPKKDWESVDPIEVGMDSDQLSKLDSMIKKQYNNINGIVVVRKGKVVLEQYYNQYNKKDAFHVASVTKSIMSALIGIAVDKGEIQSIDEPVLNFFPDYVANPSQIQKKAVTLRHLLTMTAPYPFRNGHEPFERILRQPDWVKYTLDTLGQVGKIGTFQYSTFGAHLLSAIITQVTKESAREYANKNLFTPIGMRVIPDYEMNGFGYEDLFGKNVRGWVKDPKGNSTGGFGLTLTTLDMARFGYLYVKDGVWNNRQIISNSWIKESTTITSKQSIRDSYHYGYLWWLIKENDIFAHLAIGDGGNMICCIPEKELVVAIASKIIMQPRDRWALIKECVLDAIIEVENEK